jgi:hypothetical protein
MKLMKPNLSQIGAILFCIFWLLTPWSITESSAITLFPAFDGDVSDGGAGAIKDGNPDRIDWVTTVQTMNVPSQEDRGIIEFDISALPTNLSPLTLNLHVFAKNGPFPFTIDVYTYAGDGSLSLGDFNAGSFFKSFEYSGASSVTIDVTSCIEDLQSSGSVFAGFNFRFAVPSTIAMNGPFVAFTSFENGGAATISDVPEPGALTLLAAVLGGIVWRNGRRKVKLSPQRN